MGVEIKSGKQVIGDFFSEIMNIEGVDRRIVEMLVSLYRDEKLTDTNIENAMGQLLQEELSRTEDNDVED